MRKRAEVLARATDTYFTNQLENHDALIGYEEMGQELLLQLPGRIAAFCGGVGVGGMLMGVARALRRVDPTTRIVALEPASAALLSSGHAGSHHVEGVGLGVVPPLLDRALLDEARGIGEPEARQMCRRLAKEEGILAGTSTGLNVVGALQLAREIGSGSTVVTVACDTGLKYLASDLFGNQSPQKNP
jgi:cysteine synthase